MEVDTPQPSWDEFKRQCHLRFGPPIRSHKLGELAKLRQSGTVPDYQENFEQLASRAGTLIQAQKIELYISSLAEYIAVEVELHNLSDLAIAMSISRLYERKGQPTRTPISEVRRSKPPDTPLQHRTRFVKKLTKDEMEETRLKGLCFNCDEPFVKGHQRKKLFRIDSVEEGDEQQTEYEPPTNTDQPEISLNAIISISTPQNMRLQGKLNGNPALTLVDSGVNWLKTLGPILWDFTNMWMSFTKLEKQIELYGIKTSKPDQSAEIQVVTVEDYYADLQRLLQDFVSLFQERTGLYNIFKLHGLPERMVSDKDVTFTSTFWKELFRLSSTKLCFSSAYHPQSDGQTTVVNRTVEMYLRCFTSAHPTKWMDLLSWAEYSYNTSFHSSLQTTPFEAVYGQPPPCLLSYCPGISKLDVVDQALQSPDMILKSLRQNLSYAQHKMKTIYDSKHRNIEFQVGDRVLLRLQPYR
ncbi:Uncharacterized protein TCM_030492 [Theobroma cacao]|uniref:Integrase catalytic domain-containing protein n=1 Tax=Theobroma cacao TaxID=3641 RepID=A0A061GGS7_THECC|nr:Uncharacterized protein TCM_030492 [Theobroma cacao]